jgi:hypothetical protein
VYQKNRRAFALIKIVTIDTIDSQSQRLSLILPEVRKLCPSPAVAGVPMGCL